MTMKRQRPEAGSFTIGWISALPVEQAAAEALLDEEYDNHGDTVQYTLGRIHHHNVVMACLPAGQIGTTAAATVATEMRLRFRALRFYLLVGIGGGVPSRDVDIRLGDVVVSEPQGEYGGVVQYDLGKTVTGGAQIRTGIMGPPSPELLMAVTKLRSSRSAGKSNLSRYLSEVSHRSEYNHNNAGPDQLFDASCDHAGETCESHIHFGTIASGNQVIKDGRTRDRLSAELNGILCFEMEAAGLMNQLRCLVIRGICDYADSHKNKTWQPFAAIAAAACAKEILLFIPHTDSAHSNQLTTAAPRSSYMESLKFDQMDARHTTIRNAHSKTCRWLLNRQEYQDWLNRDLFSRHRGFLWIKGKPATGKSTIMKFTYRQTVTKSKDTVIIAFFFNARGEEMERSVLGMYQSLLYQLLGRLPDLQDIFDSLQLMHLMTADSHQWDVGTLQRLFKSAIEKLGQRPLICFIDALDECEEDQVRDMITFFEELGEIALQHKCYLQVCFSSRHYPHISIASGIELVLENQEGHEHDILNYIESELRIGKSELAKQIKSEVLQRASGIFLWAVLVVQMLNKLADRGQVHRLRKQLSEIPSGLHDLLRDILLRDERNTANMVICFQWILYAKRPLRREELYFAILSGVEKSAESFVELNRQVSKEDMKRFILDSSKGLAEETRSKKPTIQFIHESVREFLLKENILDTIEEAAPQNTFPALSHDALKHCCMIYIGIDLSAHLRIPNVLPKASSDDAKHLRQHATEEFPFLEYAVQHVLHHSDAAEEYGLSQNAFLQRFPLRRWILLNNLFEKYEIRRYTPHASQLYIFADKNLLSITRVALKHDSPTRSGVERYGSPIVGAIVRRNEAALRALLPLHNDATTESTTLLSPPPPHEVVISFTSLEYQLAIDCLLDLGEKTVLAKNFRLLRWVVANGHTEIFKLLANIEPENSIQQTPLFLAAGYGHLEIIKLFIEIGADIESKDSHQQTVLFWAGKNGHTEIVKFLIGNGADIEAKDSDQRTPLSWAAATGRIETAKLLLENGAYIDYKDSMEQTPLSIAAANGHTEIVKLLLENGVYVDSKDYRQQTSLSIAAICGHTKIVKLLLENDAYIDSKDLIKQTPIALAVINGHTESVKLLLENGAYVDSIDFMWQTPLMHAAIYGYTKIVKLLLDHGANIESIDSTGKTLIGLAMTYGHTEIVKLLLDHGAEDLSWGTPRSLAVSYQHTETAGLLSGNDTDTSTIHSNLSTHAGHLEATSVTQQTILDSFLPVAQQQLETSQEWLTDSSISDVHALPRYPTRLLQTGSYSPVSSSNLDSSTLESSKIPGSLDFNTPINIDWGSTDFGFNPDKHLADFSF
ncbi:Pfs, NACHT and ankyrin domain protein [Paecilomyces variotii No. 5]|uniref:Pfs, NACHT and ankyrin domain protein n=1 Tax=Byssochlamys spectabilis (strain No. 5 / NBRC 109023) TaxID=1356009 RepID=V5FTV0_BYSSN|nr:Pfs, NACHT and ankyrin domain protein [Paecilomyces variotii No. 5]